MPELPEVETSRRGIEPHILGKTVRQVIVRQARLRWLIPEQLSQQLPGLAIEQITRRGKYLLLHTPQGVVLIHLGMSGNLRIGQFGQAAGKHDHIDLVFEDGTLLRFNDSRRFGAVLWTTEPVSEHPLLQDLGPEPLSDAFDGQILFAKAKNRLSPVKSLIMDSHVVVGVGNIYANEALFAARLHPEHPAKRIGLAAYDDLAAAIKTILQQAIEQGGTTLRDFVNENGKPGYFQQELKVYGRKGEGCRLCGAAIELIKIAQRASYYCPQCQSREQGCGGRDSIAN